MSPLALDDHELSQLFDLAQAVPVAHRDNFLRAVAEALNRYPELGPGLVFRLGRELQRY